MPQPRGGAASAGHAPRRSRGSPDWGSDTFSRATAAVGRTPCLLRLGAQIKAVTAAPDKRKRGGRERGGARSLHPRTCPGGEGVPL